MFWNVFMQDKSDFNRFKIDIQTCTFCFKMFYIWCQFVLKCFIFDVSLLYESGWKNLYLIRNTTKHIGNYMSIRLDLIHNDYNDLFCLRICVIFECCDGLIPNTIIIELDIRIIIAQLPNWMYGRSILSICCQRKEKSWIDILHIIFQKMQLWISEASYKNLYFQMRSFLHYTNIEDTTPVLNKVNIKLAVCFLNKLVEVVFHSCVLNIWVQLWSFHSNWWFNIKVGMISLHKSTVTNR